MLGVTQRVRQPGRTEGGRQLALKLYLSPADLIFAQALATLLRHGEFRNMEMASIAQKLQLSRPLPGKQPAPFCFLCWQAPGPHYDASSRSSNSESLREQGGLP